jgi:hypothetical protein
MTTKTWQLNPEVANRTGLARDQVDSMIAFDRLRRAARDTQSKIGDVAQRLVSTGRLPNETSRSASP